MLPSHFEPWGVVVHEFAATGMPIVSSDVVGACTAFLKNDYNGYRYSGGNVAALKAALEKIMALPPDRLVTMGDRSYELSKQISPSTWAAAVGQLL